MPVPPWATGPAELLEHGAGLLGDDTDAARRLAMIAIDNCVELTVRTYLGLPKRVTGLSISRRKFNEISESFPDMLDALEEHAADKLVGIDLGEIEWFHRLRNQLYHNGNGLTVERAKVDVYVELARLLWKNLLGVPDEPAPDVPPTAAEHDRERLLGEFLTSYVHLERALANLAAATAGGAPPHVAAVQLYRVLLREGVLDVSFVEELEELRRLRNELVHGASTEAERSLTPEIVEATQRATARLHEIIQRESSR